MLPTIQFSDCLTKCSSILLPPTTNDDESFLDCVPYSIPHNAAVFSFIFFGNIDQSQRALVE